MAVLARDDLDHQRQITILLLQAGIAVDEGLELLDAIEDRLGTHPGARLFQSCKRAETILLDWQAEAGDLETRVVNFTKGRALL